VPVSMVLLSKVYGAVVSCGRFAVDVVYHGL
jgi:hypothetical protein